MKKKIEIITGAQIIALQHLGIAPKFTKGKIKN